MGRSVTAYSSSSGRHTGCPPPARKSTPFRCQGPSPRPPFRVPSVRGRIRSRLQRKNADSLTRVITASLSRILETNGQLTKTSLQLFFGIYVLIEKLFRVDCPVLENA